MLERMRVSRRDLERARQILMVQRRVAGGRRRRGKAPPLKRRDYFDEALQVHELVAQVIRPDEAALSEVQRWRQRKTHGSQRLQGSG